MTVGWLKEACLAASTIYLSIKIKREKSRVGGLLHYPRRLLSEPLPQQAPRH